MDRTHIPAITYHQVLSDDMELRIRAPGSAEYSGQIYLRDFVRQMDYLAENGFATLTHEDLHAWMVRGAPLPPRPIVIDFDDHSMISYKNALPVMKERGLRATMFVVTGLADGDPAICSDMWSVARMRWRELERLVEAGWHIGAHTRTHLYLGTVPAGPEGDARIMWELTQGQADIEKDLGMQPRHFAYPNGSWNERTERLAKQVYDSARLFHAEGRVQYITSDTNVCRLPTMNISYQVPFEDFRALVSRTDPDFELVLKPGPVKA